MPEELDHQANRDAAAMMASAMLDLSDATAPMHDWLAGERAYFLSQGYTPDEARALAAATYVSIFGNQIRKTDQS